MQVAIIVDVTAGSSESEGCQDNGDGCTLSSLLVYPDMLPVPAELSMEEMKTVRVIAFMYDYKKRK